MAKVTKQATPKPKKATKRKIKPKDREAEAVKVMVAGKDFIQKKYGKGAAQMMDELDSSIPGFISTQSLAVDRLVGNGGVPITRIIEIFGPEGAGKSTLADHILAEVQAQHGIAYLWDTENARDHRYVDQVGIVRRRAVRLEADVMEQGFAMIKDLLDFHNEKHPGHLGIICWDTVAGTPTEAELSDEKNAEAFGPAKLIRSELRQVVTRLKRSNFIFVAVNQEYTGHKNNRAIRFTYGGGGFPYWSSTRLSVWPGEKIFAPGKPKDSGWGPWGQVIHVRCVKNKAFPPLRIEKAAINFGKGIDNTWSLFDTLRGAGYIKGGKGGWYNFDPDAWKDHPEMLAFPSWQSSHFGLHNLCKDHPDVWEKLIDIYNQVFLEVEVAP